MPSVREASIWVVIAAYNEAAVIGRVLCDLIARRYNVIVVDDGSRDATATVAARAGAWLVPHPVNLGQGAALQTGIKFALAHGASHIITFDADGQHRAADIPRLIDALDTGRADFALGSRFLGRSLRMPPSRRWLLRAATAFTRLTTGLKVTDTHNGLRAMTRRGGSRLALRQNRMAHASEILEQMAHSGLGYVEVPVTIDYSPYSLAKGQRLADMLMIMLDLCAQRLTR